MPRKSGQTPPSLAKLVAALDAEMHSDGFQDESNNGLQVACGDKPIRKVCCGVDASLACFEAAAAQGADLAICHHGISWGDSLKRITGLNYRQVAFLIHHDMALWACHLPLDAHATLGNNAGLAKALGLRNRKPFGRYHGVSIGFAGTLPRPLSRDAFQRLLTRKIQSDVRSMPFGRAVIRTVGIVSGGAAEAVAQAAEARLDAYVSGEATLQGYNLAEQLGINAFFCGHYATERFGVQAVGSWIERHFGIPASFIDLQLPY
jgi:dinuclear metal center YbgI/SA1388 family protein